MYVTGNPKSKKELREWILSGRPVTLFAPGLGTPIRDGIETVEGPHSPAAHSWYARVKVREGFVVKIVS